MTGLLRQVGGAIARADRIALILILLVIAFALAAAADNRRQHRSLRESEQKETARVIELQRLSCERVNRLRMLFNKRGEALLAFTMTEAQIERAILKSAQSGGPHESIFATPDGSTAAAISPSIRARIRALQRLAAAFGPAPLTDCAKASSIYAERIKGGNP